MPTISTPISNFNADTYLQQVSSIHQRVIRNIGVLDPSLDNSPGAGQLVIKRPWIDEPSGSIPIDAQNGLALPIVGDPEGVVLAYTVPDGYDGVIKFISNNVTFGGFVQFSGDIIWRITANARPIRNFEEIKNERGSIAQGRIVSPIRIYSGQVIRYLVNHIANGALAGQVICSFNGYIYPSRSID